MTKHDDRIVEGSGNVFRDLGNSPARVADLEMRSQLMMALLVHIASQGWNSRQAAHALGVQPRRITDLLGGSLSRLSLDALVVMAGKARLGTESA